MAKQFSTYNNIAGTDIYIEMYRLGNSVKINILPTKSFYYNYKNCN